MSFKFKFPESWLIKQQEEYEKQYVIYQDEKIHIDEFEDKSITPQHLSDMRMNSYAREKLYPKLSTDALINTSKSYLSQCSRGRYPAITYDDALIHLIVPELLNRIEELEVELIQKS